MNIYNESRWQELRPFLVMNVDRGNIDLRRVKNVPSDLFDWALSYVDHCIRCGDAMHPIRFREKEGEGDEENRIAGTKLSGAPFFSPSCTKLGCSRGTKASAEKKFLREMFGCPEPLSLSEQTLRSAFFSVWGMTPDVEQRWQEFRYRLDHTKEAS